eukprot:COSAG01_NODE_247_length_20443_cov_52.339543_7_plen_200_part_00
MAPQSMPICAPGACPHNIDVDTILPPAGPCRPATTTCRRRCLEQASATPALWQRSQSLRPIPSPSLPLLRGTLRPSRSRSRSRSRSDFGRSWAFRMRTPAQTSVSRPFPSWSRSILAEIYLCHACSCQETLRTEPAGQVARGCWRSIASASSHAPSPRSCGASWRWKRPRWRCARSRCDLPTRVLAHTAISGAVLALTS